MQRNNSNQRRSYSSSPSRRSGRPFFSTKNPRSRAKRNVRGEVIDIQRFVKKASTSIISDPIKIKNRFKDFGFAKEIMTNLNIIGYVDPTSIQDQSIKHIINGEDLLGLANTGTGKTAAFLLPLIDKCFRDTTQKVLIITPTRELAQQIDDEFRKFARNMGLRSVVCVGGLPIFRQIADLKRRPNFIIGTPGRLKDLKDRTTINFNSYQNVVLDEIDRMLDMGFIEEIRRVLAELPAKRQLLFFSATMPPKIETLVRQFLTKPIMVKTVTSETAVNIDQDIIKSAPEEKFAKLMKVLAQKEMKKVLIFSETKRDVERVCKNLIKNNFRAESLHGDKRQSQRQRALLRFKKHQVQILVATDVAARGLDISDITHVINYTVPQTYEDYIHRIGRTGRGTKKGIALTFVNA